MDDSVINIPQSTANGQTYTQNHEVGEIAFGE